MNPAPPLDPFYRLVHLSETGSTNDDAKHLASEGAPAGTLVWADCQSTGRGRRGRRWESPVGNLYMSLVLRPETALSQAGQLGFAASLAIAETAQHLLPGRSVACKWPNDVLADGHKIAGLLLEAEMDGGGRTRWLVLGIGINIANHPDGVEFPATSLAALGATASVGEVLAELSGRFLVWYRRWEAAGFGPIREAWLARAAGVGQPVRVRLETQTLDGMFSGLDEEGALLLHRAADGSVPLRITAGDLFFPQLPGRA